MIKWIFLWREFLLTFILLLLTCLLPYALLTYFELAHSLISAMTLSSVFGLILIPSISFLHHVRKLSLLGVDFAKEANQNGSLEIKIHSVAPEPILIDALRLRKTKYAIVKETLNKHHTELIINDSSCANAVIKLSISQVGHRQSIVTLSTSRNEASYSWNPLVSRDWKYFSEHLFHFHRLIKDKEVAYLKQATAHLK